jgi:hypothetical protein
VRPGGDPGDTSTSWRVREYAFVLHNWVCTSDLTLAAGLDYVFSACNTLLRQMSGLSSLMFPRFCLRFGKSS